MTAVEQWPESGERTGWMYDLTVAFNPRDLPPHVIVKAVAVIDEIFAAGVARGRAAERETARIRGDMYETAADERDSALARVRKLCEQYDYPTSAQHAIWPDDIRHALTLGTADAATDAAHSEVRCLVDALADCVVKATERGVQDGEFVGYYWLPTGPIHRAIPLLQEHGVTVRPGFDGRKRGEVGA